MKTRFDRRSLSIAIAVLACLAAMAACGDTADQANVGQSHATPPVPAQTIQSPASPATGASAAPGDEVSQGTQTEATGNTAAAGDSVATSDQPASGTGSSTGSSFKYAGTWQSVEYSDIQMIIIETNDGSFEVRYFGGQVAPGVLRADELVSPVEGYGEYTMKLVGKRLRVTNPDNVVAVFVRVKK